MFSDIWSFSGSRVGLALWFVIPIGATKHSAISPHYVKRSPASGENRGTEAKPWLGLIFGAAPMKNGIMTIRNTNLMIT
jgi:hypothetical protein